MGSLRQGYWSGLPFPSPRLLHLLHWQCHLAGIYTYTLSQRQVYTFIKVSFINQIMSFLGFHDNICSLNILTTQCNIHHIQLHWASLTVQMVKNLRPGFNPWVGKILGGGHGNPLQYSHLENPIDRGAWWATVHGLRKRQTWLRDQAQHIQADTKLLATTI